MYSTYYKVLGLTMEMVQPGGGGGADCFMYRIKPKELYILCCEKGRGRRLRPFPQLRMENPEGFN